MNPVMRFFVANHPTKFPAVVLGRDSWDDYFFKTTFRMTFYRSETQRVGIGDVKILMDGQEGGPTELPEEFDSLDERYCSLGQNLAYYEFLLKLGKQIYLPILWGLRDVVLDPKIKMAFEEDKGFQNSLLRTDAARRALEDGPVIFAHHLGVGDRAIAADLALEFKTSVGGSSFPVSFDFSGPPELPGRTNVLIGYNGAGKTKLLSNLAMVASQSASERDATPEYFDQFGSLIGNPKPFGAIIVVSYSAFDTFDIPGKTDVARERLEKTGEVFGYVYCGLRTFTADQDRLTEPRGLKSIDALTAEFRDAVQRALEHELRALFIKVLSPLATEPSFQRIGLLSQLDLDADGWTGLFKTLSSGHKIVLNIVAKLVAHLQRKSLVLIDEPEAHLHPPLLAALLKSIRIALHEKDSVAIIATHSPVVLQETPRSHVRVLRRYGQKTSVEKPPIETFGEDVGTLTRDVFNLDNSLTDFHDVLQNLASQMPLEKIETLFGNKLGFQAASYVVSVRGQGRK
jgi:energy-coupling factor transporter ATP-binding protein EcfA2